MFHSSYYIKCGVCFRWDVLQGRTIAGGNEAVGRDLQYMWVQPGVYGRYILTLCIHFGMFNISLIYFRFI